MNLVLVFFCCVVFRMACDSLITIEFFMNLILVGNVKLKLTGARFFLWVDRFGHCSIEFIGKF
jgi:hypothetical protein